MTRYRMILACCLAVGLGGCNWFVPLAFILPDTRKVEPEYAKLVDCKAVVVVWAEPETLYDYPYIRLEASSHIGDRIRANVEGIHLVNARKVEDFIQRTPEAAFNPELVGEHFRADAVVYVELLEFQIRDPESPDLLQGKARAEVTVHDLRSEEDDYGTQELESVELTVPEQPVLYTAAAPTVIRNQTYDKLAELVARKFYEHDEKI